MMLLLLFCALLFVVPCAATAQGGQIRGVAWNDSANDLTYSEGDRTLNRVAVTLYRVLDSGEEEVGKVSTGSNGEFLFENLPAGQYYLSVKLPDGYQFTLPKEGGSCLLPACGRASTTEVFTLAEGQMIRNAHIGASKSSGYIKAYAFHDENANGGRRVAEEQLRGVPAQLLYEYKGEWVTIATATTDREGCASFWDLTPGAYRLRVTLPDPYIVGPLGEKVSAWYNVIVPSDSSTGTSETFDVPRGGSTGLGIGAVTSGALMGQTWYDANCNGMKDAGETGFQGASLQLVSEAAGVSRTISTGADGSYLFEKLLEGSYTLTVTLPEGYMFTLPGGESLMTDGYQVTASTQINVEKDKTAAVQIIGIMPATSLNVRIYNDLNANGVCDENEPPYAGATLDVLKENEVLLSTLSDGDGLAAIPVLRGGDMTLRLTLSSGQVFTVAGEDNQFVSDAAQSSILLPYDVQHGVVNTLSAGATVPSSISGQLFNDVNVSSLWDAGENTLPEFTVQAVSEEGKVVAETLTDATGYYIFDALLPAPHRIRFCLKDAYVFSDYADLDAPNRSLVLSQNAQYGETDLIALHPGQIVENIIGGAFRSATVSGQVLLSAGKAAQVLEGGMEGVLVELMTEDGLPVSATTTALTQKNGSFYLKGALPGTYRLQYTLPENCLFTDPLQDSATLLTAPFTLGTADDLTQPTRYAVPAGSLTGTLYYMNSDNKQYDDGVDMPLPAVTLTLINNDYNVTFETRTLDSGYFAFYNLRPGDYTLSLALDSMLCFAVDDSSLIPATIHNTAEVDFTISAGEHLTGRNIAASTPSSISGQLYFDLENNGSLDENDPGAQKITLVLQSADAKHSYTAITDENGCFTLSPVVPGNYHLLVSLLSDCVPADDNPAQLVDGFYLSNIYVQDSMEAEVLYGILRYATISGRVYGVDGSTEGITGRTLMLYDGSGALLGQTLSDANGVYSFSNLKPGQYAVSCDLPDAAYRFAGAAGNLTLRSIINRETLDLVTLTGASDAEYVAMGENAADWHIGIGKLGKIGDTAWLDENGNGLQDKGEKGLPGILIEIYQYDEKVAETITNVYGRYQLTDLFPGPCTIKVVMPEEVATTVCRSDFPLLASILPEGLVGTAETTIIVPGGGRNLNFDLGFKLIRENEYPASMDSIPTINWDY